MVSSVLVDVEGGRTCPRNALALAADHLLACRVTYLGARAKGSIETPRSGFRPPSGRGLKTLEGSH